VGAFKSSSFAYSGDGKIYEWGALSEFSGGIN
jgi:hypothetical protein